MASKSGYFARELVAVDTLKLPFEDPGNVFPLIVQFMYRNQLRVESEQVVPLTVMAGHLEINSLSVRFIALFSENNF